MLYDRNDYINKPSEIQKELEMLFNKQESITIFDIGACEGEDSIKYAKVFPKAQIYTFEPLQKNLERIRNNIIKYNIKNVKIVDKALSSQKGTYDFFVSEGRPEGIAETDWDYGNKSSSLLAPDKFKEIAKFLVFSKIERVEATTLDIFCSEMNINNVDFVHMDVQGAELMVLNGSRNMIDNIKVIWIEVSKITVYKDQPLVDDIKSFMAKNDFFLLKDGLTGIQGDHLYISKNYFPNFQKLYKVVNKKKFSLKNIFKGI